MLGLRLVVERVNILGREGGRGRGRGELEEWYNEKCGQRVEKIASNVCSVCPQAIKHPQTAMKAVGVQGKKTGARD